MQPLGPPARPVAHDPWARPVAWIRWFGPLRMVSGVAGFLLLGIIGLWALHAPAPAAVAPDPTGRTAGPPSQTADRDGELPLDQVPLVTLVGRPPLEAPSQIVVHLAGAVVSPGVHTLDNGARVVDAVAAAGGPLVDAELDALNLAAVVVDGQRIHVPRVGEVVVGPDPVTAQATPTVVDINRASANELEALPGVGPAIAAEIVAERERHGPFGDVDDLLRVRGIGPTKLAALRDRATVS